MGWIRLGPWRRLASSPSSPPRTISLQNFQRVDQQHQQQEQGTIAPETSLLETSPTPNNSTRRRRGWFVWVLLNLACLFLATAAALLVFRKPVSAYLQGTPFARKDNSHDRRTITEEGLTELPFLTGGRIVGEKGTIPRIEGADPSHWVRVVSPLSMHPAMYVPGDGMVYCPIAKVACAEWRKTLRWMLGIPDWNKGPIHDEGKNGIPLLARKQKREVELMMNDKSWLKFVVVRDPADRILSCFLNKCLGGEWNNCPYVEFMPERFEGDRQRNASTDKKFWSAAGKEPRVLFRDFMEGVRRDVEINGCKVNSHWRPQHCFCSISRFREAYHVIPFSNMSTEAVKLVDYMQRPSPERATMLREFIDYRFSSNQDTKARGASAKRERFFSEESLALTKQVFFKDYELFSEYFENHVAYPLPV